MNIRRVQGWALIISALTSVLILVFNLIGLSNRIQYLPETLGLISALLFIFGLPSIQAVQPITKLWGQIGLTLMSIPAVDKFIFWLIQLFVEQPVVLNNLASSVWNMLASAGVVYLGYILVGWLTIRARVFPKWVGLLLFIVGVFNNILWLLVSYASIDFVPFSIILNSMVFIDLLEAASLLGYGWIIVRYKTFLDNDEINVLKHKGDIESLIKILHKKNEPDWLFRLDAAEALAQNGVEQGVDYLNSVLEGSDTDARNEAREILEELNIQRSNAVLQSGPSK